MTWFPPEGARFDLDAYADTPGTVTELNWAGGDGQEAVYPALVTSVAVKGDGSEATATLKVLEARGEAGIADVADPLELAERLEISDRRLEISDSSSPTVPAERLDSPTEQHEC